MYYLPSKKFILIIIILAIIFTAGFVFYKYKNSPLKKELAYEKKSAAEPKKLNEFLDKDTDNDGLKDWEETLWKTDINNIDTDKDGTSDGEEVKINRDPTKTGPNDKLEIEKGESATSTDTLTQKLGKEFLADYLTKKGKDALTQNQKESIVNSMLLNLENANEEQISSAYETKDIKVSSDNSKEAIKKYVNSLGVVFQNFNSIKREEMSYLAEILFNEDEEFQENIKGLENNRLVYEKSVADLLKTPVPSKYQNIHLGIINQFNGTAAAIAKMELIYNDPAQTILGIQEYFFESEKTIPIFKNFKEQFNKDKITLTPDEAGYIFVRDYFSLI